MQQFVFFIFNDNLFAHSQSYSFFNSVFIMSIISFVFGPDTGFVPVLENLESHGFDNLDSRPGKSWNFGPGPGKSWNFMLANLYAA